MCLQFHYPSHCLLYEVDTCDGESLVYVLKEAVYKQLKPFEELDLFVFLVQLEGHLNDFHICNFPSIDGHHLILIVFLVAVKVRDLDRVSFDVSYAMERE